MKESWSETFSRKMLVKNKKDYYQISELVREELVHGFSTKQFGNMSYKYGNRDEVETNRLKYLSALGLVNNSFVQMNLDHGTNVCVVTEANGEKITSRNKILPKTDGIITDRPNLNLWMLTGDCAPFLFYDPKKKVIGLAHCGWRGTIGKLPLIMVLKMITEFGSGIDDILVGVGPSIEKCCYVEPVPAVQENLPEWREYINLGKNSRIRIDLNGFSIDQLAKAGVPRENIYFSNYCTKDHSDEFYCSQQETARTAMPGRFASVISMI